MVPASPTPTAPPDLKSQHSPLTRAPIKQLPLHRSEIRISAEAENPSDADEIAELMMRTRTLAATPSQRPPPINRADKPKNLGVSTTAGQHPIGARGDDSTAEPKIEHSPYPRLSRPRSLIQTSSGHIQPAQVPHFIAQRVRHWHHHHHPDVVPGASSDGPPRLVSETPPTTGSGHFKPSLPPRREAAGNGDVARPKLIRVTSFTPTAGRAPTVSISAPFRFADAVSRYPPPPQRSATASSLERVDLPSNTSFPLPEQQQPQPQPQPQPPPRRSSVIDPPRRLVATRDPAPAVFSDDLDPLVETPSRPTDEHPDASRAYRRRPYSRNGLTEIAVKHDVRLIAISGEHVCTVGHSTKIMSLRNGESIMSVNDGEPIRVTSLAFKPSHDPQAEGRWLWLGTSHGDVQEIDVLNQAVEHVKTSAHPRREVIKIFPHPREMWTLDDEGKLHVWPPDQTGTASLKSTPCSFRVPKGHSFSLRVGDELWIAAGREIRVFRPSSNADGQFTVLAKPLHQPGVEDVTSASATGFQSDHVLFGHADGNVTVYSRIDYACVNVVSLSLYKINTLVGVGDYLWAGFNTGMIYVYDTTSRPWRVKKDWHAHDSPVTEIIVDRTRVPKLGPLQVASLGTDETVRLWDGILQDDWLGTC